MESLITTYDNIFFNKERICKLIDNYNQSSSLDKLEALGELINGYIIYRGQNFPDTSPMSIPIFIKKLVSPRLLESVINELAGDQCPVSIQNAKGNTYISLY